MSVLRWSKDVQESFGHMDQQEEKAGKTEPKGARSSRVADRLDRPITHSIDPYSATLDRSHAKGVARSIPCRATKLDRSRSVQPFDQSRSDDITAVRSTWCKPT
ncbi:unnamed protein product [Microthlaspi erraticum]|uniref:Uncharacterized protein n=1 Tax=Microthlaspi erraticum TaxID=1685480 RepID=A0A6D2JZI8_9BRAS|nr:unnamed protein product [Microthlaspi erraticum]